MEFFYVSLLNGLSYGLLLFLLSAGLTLIFSMLGVVNFAHASFYMLGAYVAWAASRVVGFWPALVVAPVIVGSLGAAFERYGLRRVHRHGHVAELLLTFGLTYVMVEVVQLLWGRSPIDFQPPALLQGPAFTLSSSPSSDLSLVWGAAPASTCSAAGASCSPFPATRAFMMLVSLVVLLSRRCRSGAPASASSFRRRSTTRRCSARSATMSTASSCSCSPSVRLWQALQASSAAPRS